jgi:transitional endoplasmic reticulum ATPase
MSTIQQISDISTIARTRAIDYDDRRLHLEFRNGSIITVTVQESLEFDVESVVLVRLEENHIEVVPDELWPEESWVGVVHLIKGEKTILSVGGQQRIVPTSDGKEYQVGNTVEVKDKYGVVEVLSERPLSSLDAPMNYETTSSRFRSEGGDETYDDFGGSEHIVAQVKELEDSLSGNGSLSATGGRPVKGVLFVGPSGTGKTMLARIIASQTGAAFFQVRGPEVVSKWVGESERTLRNLFDDAAQAQEGRASIFFDEIDSIAGRRDALTHDFSRSVVAQLLTLMDGFKPTTNVLVIAATNRQDVMDPALRRPGRFDLEIPFDLPEERDREEILRAAARKQDGSGSLPHGMIAKKTDSWTPAELAGIWHAAVRIAFREGRGEVDEEDYRIGHEQVAAQRRRKMSPRSEGQAT